MAGIKEEVDLTQADDLELVRRYKSDGDQGCFEILFQRYARYLYVISLRMLRDSSLAEDLVQETFAKAVEKIGSFEENRDRASFKAWLITICRNACLDEIRKLDRRKQHEKEMIQKQGSNPGGMVEPERDLIFREVVEELRKLRDVERICWMLHSVEGFKYKEIATLLNLNENTVKTHIRRAQRALERKFQ